MKKIISITLLLLLVVGFLPTSYTDAGPDITFSISNWTPLIRNNKPYIISDPIQIESDNFEIILDNGIFITEYEDAFVKQIVTSSYGWTSKIVVSDDYDLALASIPHTTINLLQQIGSDYLYTDYDFSSLKYKYITIHLLLDSTLDLGDANDIAFYMNTYDYAYDYWITGSNELETSNTIADLPLTAGSIYEDVEDVGLVYFNYDDSTGSFYAYVHYYGTYLLDIPLVDLPYDDFFENVEVANYYSYEGQKFIVFYYDETELFQIDTGSEVPGFKGWSIWNLTTNEVVTINKMYVLTYIDIVNDTEPYAYMYIPEIDVEDLLSVSLTYKYRMAKSWYNIFGDANYTDWSIESQVLEKDLSTDASMEQWVYDSYVYSAASILAGTVLSIIPGTQPIGIPLLLSGGLLFNTANVGAISNLLVKDITQLERINYPSTDLKDTINQHFSTLKGTSINIDGDPLYRLYLGNYSGLGLSQIEIDDSSFEYTEVVFQTNGEIFVLDDEYIDQDVITDFDDTASLPEYSERTDVVRIAILGVVSLAFIGIAFKVKAFNKISHVIILVVLWIAFVVGFGLL